MRLATYVYGLLYPGFLGSFLFGSLTAPFPDGWHIWAALLMLVYFAAQYGEGATVAFQPGPDGNPRYGKAEAAIDLGEILAMAAIMAAIGVFGGTPTGLVAILFDTGDAADHWLWMALAFALPPLGRVALSFAGRRDDRRSHDLKAHNRLTLLSITAACGALAGLIAPPLGLSIITLALLTYLAFFIAKPDLGEGLVREALWGENG